MWWENSVLEHTHKKEEAKEKVVTKKGKEKEEENQEIVELKVKKSKEKIQGQCSKTR